MELDLLEAGNLYVRIRYPLDYQRLGGTKGAGVWGRYYSSATRKRKAL